MSLAARDLEALLSSFIEDLNDPEAGDRIWRAYASLAPIYYQLSLTTPSETALETFKSYHRAAHEGGVYATRPVLKGLKFLHVGEQDEAKAVVWFKATEAEDALEIFIVVGFVWEENAWKIGWLALREGLEDLSYAAGNLQMLSEYGFTKSGKLSFPRSALDVGHYRLFGHAKPKLLTLQDARFSCHMSAGCCIIDHAINLNPEAQRVIDALPQDKLPPSLRGTQLPKLADGYLELKQTGHDCRFLNENRHCRIHQAVGRAVFPPCAVFPFAFTETPAGVAVTASPSCSSIRGNLGVPLAEKSADLHQRLAMGGLSLRMPAALHLSTGQEIDPERFALLESRLLANLERHEWPLRRRLWLGIALLEAGEADEAALASALVEPIPVCEGPTRELAQILLHGLITHTKLAAPGTAPHPDAELSPRQAFWLQNSLKQLYHSKQYAYHFDVITAHNTAILFYVLTLTMASAASGNELSNDQWALLGAMFLQNGFKSVLAGDSDYSAALREIMAQPDFGRALLGFMRLSTAAPAKS